MKIVRILKFVGLGITGILGLLLVLVLLVITLDFLDDSEGSYVECAPLDKRLAHWFPYKRAEALSFSSGPSHSERVVFDSLYVQHTNGYYDNLKCGTCEDESEAVLRIGADTVRIRISNENGRISTYTTINEKTTDSTKLTPSKLLIMRRTNGHATGITAVCFSPRQGLVWYERHQQRFLPARQVVATASEPKLYNVAGCH